MTNLKYSQRLLYAGLCLSLMFGACKKSFIDGQAPTNSATHDQVFASADAVRVYFNGIYRVMRSQWQSSDAAAGGYTDTWGYNSIQMTRDVKGTDIVMPANSWYYRDYQNNYRNAVQRPPLFVWYFLYELINQCNVLIDGTQKSTTILDADKVPLIAEARALRGWFLFELAREFQLPYGKDPSAPGVPVYTTPDPATSTPRGNPRGTLQQTFDQINGDIEFALQNLGTSQLLSDQVNITVAWGMAARIYLEQGRWADAENAAKNAIQGGALDPVNYPNNYNGVSSPEVLWALPQTTSNGGQSLYYGTPSSLFEMTGAGYDAFYMSAELVSHFSNTDVRNTFFVINKNNDPTAANYVATNKFGTSAGPSVTVTLLNGSIVPQKTIDFNETLNMMRVGEMYLISAEAKARQNKPEAADTLYSLQKNRDPNAVKSGNTGTALINEILLERRKELYGELGIDWLDLKRLQQPIDRTHSNHPKPYNYVIPANDPRFNLQIPQNELQANPNMKASDQNP